MISLVHSGALYGATPEWPRAGDLVQKFGIGAVKTRLPIARSALLRGSIGVLLAVAAICTVPARGDQTAPQKRSSTAAARSHRRAVAKVPTSATQAPTVTPEQLAPKPPNWPANDQPANATVVWNSKGLQIDAANSSLKQILKDVATETGAQVSGLAADQRIFGTYGPGPARDVISQLLDGSGYNVLMIGEQGQGTPRQIVLSKEPTGPAPATMNSQSQGNDDNGGNAEVDEQPQPPPPPPQQQPAPSPNNPNGFVPGSQPRTPQQILQEMQQRQQQIEQMQQQQRNNPQ